MILANLLSSLIISISVLNLEKIGSHTFFFSIPNSSIISKIVIKKYLFSQFNSLQKFKFINLYFSNFIKSSRIMSINSYSFETFSILERQFMNQCMTNDQFVSFRMILNNYCYIINIIPIKTPHWEDLSDI